MYHISESSAFEELEKTTAAESGYSTVFTRPLAGQALIDDNDNFSTALIDQMDDATAAKFVAAVGVPNTIASPRELRVLAAAAVSGTANYLNISLRAEMIRASLNDALWEATKPSQLLGWFDDFGKKFVAGGKKLFTRPAEWFESIGRQVGKGLRQFGDNIHNFRELLADKWGGWAIYFADFIVLTPGVKFLFGDMLRQVGKGIETGKSIDWKNVAAGYAQYLSDMSLVLSTVSNFLPPPWNIVAKVVSVIYKAASVIITWQLAMHAQKLAIKAQEQALKARTEYENALKGDFQAYFSVNPPPMLVSYFGSSGSNNPTGVIASESGSKAGMVLIAAALIGYWIINR